MKCFINKNYKEFYPVLDEGANRADVEQKIEEICNETAGSFWISYENTDKQLEESYSQIKMLSWGLILFIDLIGILNIINTTYTNIHTRIIEIGIGRAMGMSISRLYKTFLWEGAYYGFIASLIGGILGYIGTVFVEAATISKIMLVSIPFLPILEATIVSI